MTKWLVLALTVGLAACGTDDDRFSGSYRGTLTINATGSQVVATAVANLLPDQDGAQLFDSGGSTRVDCNLAGLDHSGDAITFRCNEVGCSCSVGTTNVTVTVATGTLVGDNLSLAFSGESGGGNAVSATFAGALEPGTR